MKFTMGGAIKINIGLHGIHAQNGAIFPNYYNLKFRFHPFHGDSLNRYFTPMLLYAQRGLRWCQEFR